MKGEVLTCRWGQVVLGHPVTLEVLAGAGEGGEVAPPFEKRSKISGRKLASESIWDSQI